MFLLRKSRKGSEETKLASRPYRPHGIRGRLYGFSPTRALRLRVSVHCRWARKPKSATLRAKECERNRTDCRCRLALSRNEHRLLPQAFRSYSFNRGAADLDGFAIANERDLNAHGSEWRKRRIIGRIVWTVGRSVRFRSLPLISAHSVVKT